MSIPLADVKIPRFKAGRANLINAGYLTLEDLASVENGDQLLKFRGVGQTAFNRLCAEAEKHGLEWKSKPKKKAALPPLKNAYSVRQKLAAALEENKYLLNEIARINNQTNWQCSCGGTDCQGQRENAKLRLAIEYALIGRNDGAVKVVRQMMEEKV